MSTSFDLIVAVDAVKSSCEFRLLDEHGAQLAYRHTNFGALPLSRQQGLFDLRNYIHSYVEVDRQPAAVAEIGTCIAKDVLGDEIFQILWKPVTPRTLRIHLPQASGENRLAAALARVPWEIARPATDRSTLDERFLFVRMVQQIDVASEPLALRDGEAVRVLFVFAEARGSRPLGARRELQELQRLMEREVYPARRVVSHVLSHGVTRERLRAQIEENGGYHIVHWSGHGRMNALELAKPGGLSNSLSGQDLLDLFVEAGGVLPRLVFLSACHSGDVLRIRDWNEFLAAARQPDPAAKDAKEAATPQGEATDKDAASPQEHDPLPKEEIAFSNQILDFKRDPPSDPGAALPRLADVLADPAFAPLQQWLAARQGDPVRLQAIIDTFLQRARQAASP